MANAEVINPMHSENMRIVFFMCPPFDTSEYQRIYKRREESDFCSTWIVHERFGLNKDKVKRGFLRYTTHNFYIFSEILTSSF
jgi:hypothetical protein